jgi:HAAS domain-containing protein
MTAGHAKQLVEGYLGRLELELLDLVPERRREIVDDIRAHIADERGGIQNETDADLMNLLDRLGDPAEIAAAARDGQPKAAPPPAGRVGAVEILALILTPIIWPAGVVLLWASSAWTTRQKLLGTLVVPGGYPALFFFVLPILFLHPLLAGVCVSGSDSSGNVTATTCTGPEWWQYALAVGVLGFGLAALVAPVAVGIYLATRLRSRPTS